MQLFRILQRSSVVVIEIVGVGVFSLGGIVAFLAIEA